MTQPMISPQPLETLLQQGLQAHQQGALPQAESAYRTFLTGAPHHADAANLLALVLHQQGNLEEAARWNEKAVALAPQDAELYSTRAMILTDLSQFEAAKAACRQGLALAPQHPDLWQNLGLAFLQEANQHEANQEKATQLYEEAAMAFQQAVQWDPGFFEAFSNLGTVKLNLKEYVDAEAAFHHALALNPQCYSTLNNLASLYQLQQDFEKAFDYATQAAAISPNEATIWEVLGTLCVQLDQKEEAAHHYQKALSLCPTLIKAHYNLGTLLQDSGQSKAAKICFESVLKLDEGHLKSLLGLANIHQRMNQTDKSLECFQKAYALSGNNAYRILEALTLPSVYESHADIVHWRTHYNDTLTCLLAEAETQGLPLENPVYDVGFLYFYLAYQGMNDRVLQEKLGQLFLNAPVYMAPTLPPFTSPQAAGRKIRIGFVSRFLRTTHTIGKLWGPLLQEINPDLFEVFLFGIEDPALAKFHVQPGPSGHYIPLPLDDIPVACGRVQSEAPDLLFYCDLGMDPTSYFMAFSRLAPVQCLTWGHPVTSGLPTMDYFLSSEGLELEKENPPNHYSETLIRLPQLGTYFQKPVLERPLNRKHFGLPETGALYVCAQSLYKFHPDFDEVLAGILQEDPNGAIILINGEQTCVIEALRRRWQKPMGENQARILFLNSMSYQEFLGLMAVADVVLDPYPFSGGNTQLETLAMGTPVITLSAPYMRGRVCTAMYEQIGLTQDCVAQTVKEYIALAVGLGKNPEARNRLKEKILAQNTVLYNNPEVLSAFETFFQTAVLDAVKAGHYADPT